MFLYLFYNYYINNEMSGAIPMTKQERRAQMEADMEAFRMMQKAMREDTMAAVIQSGGNVWELLSRWYPDREG